MKVLYIGDSETVISRYCVRADVFDQFGPEPEVGAAWETSGAPERGGWCGTSRGRP